MSDPCDCDGVSVGTGVCGCYFGDVVNPFSALCTNTSIGACSSFLPTLSPLVTSAVAEFMTSQSGVSNDLLTVVIETPPALRRYVSYVAFNGAAPCAFPSAGYLFQKGYDTATCQDSYTGVMDIQDLTTNCGFQVSSDANNTYLTGTIDITVIDALPEIRGVPIFRSTSVSMNLEISLPTTITLTSENLTIISPISTFAAVTGQSYTQTGDFATVLITTSVQSPYYLGNASLFSAPDFGFNVTVTLFDNSGCPDVVNDNCFQVWQVIIQNIAGSEACYLDGNYVFEWEYGCVSSFGVDCPVPPGSQIPTITTTLASENVCGTVSIVSNLAGAINSYSDNGFSIPALVYEPGSRYLPPDCADRRRPPPECHNHEYSRGPEQRAPGRLQYQWRR